MTKPHIKRVRCLSPSGLHTVAYKEWGDPHNTKVLVCVHGLTRVSGDFDTLAKALCGEYRVICPDIAGRGMSEWLRNPVDYDIPQYVSDMVSLLAQVHADTVDWVGTSMGGLIGIGLAAKPGHPIRKLVLNDIGPGMESGALVRIADYVGQPLLFPTLQAGVEYIRSIAGAFGPHTDEEWQKLAEDVLVQTKDGQWTRHHDLAMAPSFKRVYDTEVHKTQEQTWKEYDAITCPTLLIRGGDSLLLSREVAQQMTQRGPKAKLVEFAGIGHAPSLMKPDQIAVIADFLRD